MKTTTTHPRREKVARVVAYSLRKLGAHRVAWNILNRAGVSYCGGVGPDLSEYFQGICHGDSFIVEHGCGCTGIHERVTLQYAMYSGYDVSTTAIARARTRSFPRSIYNALSMQDWRGEREPVDMILVKEALYYLTRNESLEFIARARKNLSAAGRLVITIHDPVKYAAVVERCLSLGARVVMQAKGIVLEFRRPA